MAMTNPIATRVAARFQASMNAVVDYYKGWDLDTRLNHLTRIYNREVADEVVAALPEHLRSDGVEWRVGDITEVEATIKGINKLDEACVLELSVWGEGRVTLSYEDTAGRHERRRFRAINVVTSVTHDVTRWVAGW